MSKVQNVFLVGAKSLGAYGGYETFVYKLTEYHQNNPNIKYHVACKANGDGCMDETKLDNVKRISDSEFEFHNARCFKIHIPQIGPAQAIYYDVAALRECCKYIKKNNIENPIVYIMACRIGPFIGGINLKLHAYDSHCGKHLNTIMILAAASFIGTNLTVKLAKNKNDRITVVDKNVDYFSAINEYNFSNVDIKISSLDENTNFEILKNQDVVYHLVSSNVPTTSNKHISQDIRINLAFSLDLLEACVRYGVKKVVFISSGGTVYGVCDVDISKLVEFHKQHGKIATLTAVVQEQQKGVLDVGGDNAVKAFREKNATDGALINAGYMVLEPQIFDYLDGDLCVFEKDPMKKLAEQGELMSYTHKGFWQCMDNKREMDELEKLLAKGMAPWKKWED